LRGRREVLESWFALWGEGVVGGCSECLGVSRRVGQTHAGMIIMKISLLIL
jgi:hypothetical protein